MRVRAALVVALLSLLPAYSAPAVSAQEQTPSTHETAGHVTVEIFGALAQVPVAAEPTPAPAAAPVLPAPVPLAPVPVMTPELANYIEHVTPPADLIRYYWRNTPHVRLMLAIAARESSLGKVARDGHIISWEACSADNPRSSAAGLFQTIGLHKRLAESMGLSWADVAGPDCVADIKLAFQLYNGGRGLSNWRPLPKV